MPTTVVLVDNPNTQRYSTLDKQMIELVKIDLPISVKV